MIVAKRKPGESVEQFINRFRKMVVSSGFLIKVKDKQRFVSKSEKKKRKKARIQHLIELEKAKE